MALLACGVLASPIVFIFIVLGLSGDRAYYFVAILFGYLIYLLSSYFAIKKPIFFSGALIGFACVFVATSLDARVQQQKNRQFCAALRADPHCTFSPQGVSCSEASSYGEFGATAGFCVEK